MEVAPWSDTFDVTYYWMGSQIETYNAVSFHLFHIFFTPTHHISLVSRRNNIDFNRKNSLTFTSSIIYSLERSFAVVACPPFFPSSVPLSLFFHISSRRVLLSCFEKMKIMKESQYVIEISHVKKLLDEGRSNYMYDVYNDDVDDMTRGKRQNSKFSASFRRIFMPYLRFS